MSMYVAAKRLYRLRLVREGQIKAHQFDGVPLRNPRDVFALGEALYAMEDVESFVILPLDAQRHLSCGGPITITRGTLEASLVHPREVFRAAIVANAASVILMHNHPSGNPTPSRGDHEVTDMLVRAGRTVEIPVDDHIIIGRGCYMSFMEAGLLHQRPEREFNTI